MQRPPPQPGAVLPPPVQPAVKRIKLDSGCTTISTGMCNSNLVPSTPVANSAAGLVPPPEGEAVVAWAHSPTALDSNLSGSFQQNSLSPPASPLSPTKTGGSSGGAVGSTVLGGSGTKGSPNKDSRGSALSAAEKVERLLQRYPQSFCQELQIDMASNSPDALWQWLCTSVLFSARIKSAAAVRACQELFRAGLTTAQAIGKAGRERVKSLLAASGYDRADDRTAEFLVYNAQAVQQQYGGDLNQLRAAAGHSAPQERTMLKKLKGTGDGAVDIFFRQVQVAWEELFPFGDKKALKAARLVGLKEHPRALADLCGSDRQKYAHLLSALVRVDMTKSYHEF